MTHLVVDPVEVGVEALAEPPARVTDLGTDVPRVRRAETLVVVVPRERILCRPTETRHVEAVLVLLVLGPAGGAEKNLVLILQRNHFAVGSILF